MHSVVPLTLVADLVLGEPPAPLHPTVWMGRWVEVWQRLSAGSRPATALAAGTALTTAGVALIAAGGRELEHRLRRWGSPWMVSLALKPALALEALLGAGRRVENALREGKLTRARRILARDLVSRDTGQLTGSEVAGAAISSLAENLSDSVIGPILAYRCGGLSGAYAYRFINTADAMLGYHTAELEWLGKVAARMDDLCNLVPSRLSALVISLAAPMAGGSSRRAIHTAWREAGRTASPNAGWPMAAMAGALGVRLRKRGAYVLHAGGRPPGPGDISAARRIVAVSAALAGAGAALG